MNANIFSCIVPPLLVLETQIIHPELLQSLCINPCVPLGSIFLVDVYARAEAFAGACRRVRARADVCACTHPSARALIRLHPRAPVCAHAHPYALALTRLCAPSSVCARAHPFARALRQRGSRFDTSASLKLSKVKRKNW